VPDATHSPTRGGPPPEAPQREAGRREAGMRSMWFTRTTTSPADAGWMSTWYPTRLPAIT